MTGDHRIAISRTWAILVGKDYRMMPSRAKKVLYVIYGKGTTRHVSPATMLAALTGPEVRWTESMAKSFIALCRKKPEDTK